MKAWRQLKNQQPLMKEVAKSKAENPRINVPSRFGRLVKRSMVKWPSFPSTLLMGLLIRQGYVEASL